MKHFLRNIINRVIDNYFDQKFGKDNKWKIRVGNDSFFGIPVTIEGGENITLGNNTTIGKMSWLAAYSKYLGNENFKPSILIGNSVNIGNYSCITAIDSIIIGNGCLFSEYIYISDHGHGFDPTMNIPPIKQPLYSKGPVEIGDNCFIGYRVSILPGVKLGKGCVVGSHSVVTGSFPDFTMIAGIPAKAIKKFNFENNTWESIVHENK